MKVLIYFLSTLAALSQTLSITTNSVVVTGTATNRAYTLEAAGALGGVWTEEVSFRGSNGAVTLPVAQILWFYRTATKQIVVTNFFRTGSFTPYRDLPGHWQAFPSLSNTSLIGGYGSIIAIDGIQWFVFTHSGNDVEIRTVNTYTNSPTFIVGDEVFLN